jgi:2-dehydropantoate 2-reductase
MKIYIIGTGGVGGYFGGKLAKAGNDVTFVARGDFFKAMKANGLTVNTTDGNFTINPVQVIETISEISNPDLIIISVKTYDTKSVAEELKKVVSDKCIIITFQNGIGNDYEIKKIVTGCKVYPGIAFVISAKGLPGEINQTGGLKKLLFGDRSKDNSVELLSILEVFKNAAIDAVLSDDIERDLWKKFVFINAFAGFTALCRTNIGAIRSDEFTHAQFKLCMKEVIAVALANNVRLPDTIYEDTVKIAENFEASSKSSLLLDIENGRQNEIETLTGNLVRLAEIARVSVPISNTIYAAIKLLNEIE